MIAVETLLPKQQETGKEEEKVPVRQSQETDALALASSHFSRSRLSSRARPLSSPSRAMHPSEQANLQLLMYKRSDWRNGS